MPNNIDGSHSPISQSAGNLQGTDGDSENKKIEDSGNPTHPSQVNSRSLGQETQTPHKKSFLDILFSALRIFFSPLSKIHDYVTGVNDTVNYILGEKGVNVLPKYSESLNGNHVKRVLDELKSHKEHSGITEEQKSRAKEFFQKMCELANSSTNYYKDANYKNVLSYSKDFEQL